MPHVQPVRFGPMLSDECGMEEELILSWGCANSVKNVDKLYCHNS